MEKKSNCVIDEKGFVWEDIGNGILITNYDGSPPMFPKDFDNEDGVNEDDSK